MTLAVRWGWRALIMSGLAAPPSRRPAPWRRAAALPKDHHAVSDGTSPAPRESALGSRRRPYDLGNCGNASVARTPFLLQRGHRRRPPRPGPAQRRSCRQGVHNALRVCPVWASRSSVLAGQGQSGIRAGAGWIISTAANQAPPPVRRPQREVQGQAIGICPLAVIGNCRRQPA
jgi:hypothetical protein